MTMASEAYEEKKDLNELIKICSHFIVLFLRWKNDALRIYYKHNMDEYRSLVEKDDLVEDVYIYHPDDYDDIKNMISIYTKYIEVLKFFVKLLERTEDQKLQASIYEIFINMIVIIRKDKSLLQLSSIMVLLLMNLKKIFARLLL
jgi:hypothetical protein